MRILLLLLITSCLYTSLLAQTKEKTAIQTPGQFTTSFKLKAPQNIFASKGTYDRYVLIRWEATEKARMYKVFRSNNAKANSLQEVSNKWQKSTWLCDYSALPNVDYYYTVVASDGDKVSPIGNMEKGFLKKSSPVAIEEKELASNSKVLYGSSKREFLLVSNISSDQITYRKGGRVRLKIGFQNIFNKATPRSEIRIFISKDTILDWNDEELALRVLNSIPPEASFELNETIQLPNDLLPGDYNIIVVSSSEGAILSSTVELTSIKIAN